MPSGWKRYFYSPLVGFASVLMGIGGGSFGVPLMTLHGVAIHRAVATAAGFGMLIAVPAVILFLVLPAGEGLPPYTLGLVNVPAFFVIIAMTILTAPLGAKLAHSMDPGPLKRALRGLFVSRRAQHAAQGSVLGRPAPDAPRPPSAADGQGGLRAVRKLLDDRAAVFRRHARPGGDLVDRTVAPGAVARGGMDHAKLDAGGFRSRCGVQTSSLMSRLPDGASGRARPAGCNRRQRGR